MGFADKYSLRIPYPAWSPDVVDDGRDFENWKELQRWADRLVADEEERRSPAYLLVLSVAGDPIASGGDNITFATVLADHGFNTAAGMSWIHPVAGVYDLELGFAWDAPKTNLTIDIWVDGEPVPGGRLANGSGSSGRGSVKYWADAGSIGRVRVQHFSGSEQTCSATMWVAIPNPDEGSEEPWTKLFSADAWGIYFDGTDWWTTSGGSSVNVTQRNIGGTALSSFSTAATTGTARGITWDGAGFWITGSDKTVARYATDGTKQTEFESEGTNLNADGAAWDGTDLWLIMDDLGGSGTAHLRRYTAGVKVEEIAIDVVNWAGLAYHDGYLWGVDRTNIELVKLTTSGATVERIDLSGATNSPTGVWIADDGTLYISADDDGVYRRSAKVT